MRTLTLLLVSALLVAPAIADTSPRKRTFKPFTWNDFGEGSWVKYKMAYNINMGGGGGGKVAQEYELIVTVDGFTDEDVTLNYQYKMNGQVFPGNKQTRKRDEVANPMMQKGAKEIKTTRERLDHKGKRLLCEVKEYEHNTGAMTLKYKIWTHHSIPTGVVKMTMNSEGPTKYDMTLETIDYERKK